MGHRSWLTYVESKQEWMDLWVPLSKATSLTDKFYGQPEEERDFLPPYYAMEYVLEVTKDGGPFKKGNIVLAWSSDGDSSIKILPYYLRQQTEYLEVTLQKFPSFHDEPGGPEKYGIIHISIPSILDLMTDDDINLENLGASLAFFSKLPESAKAEWGEKNEVNFIQHLYYSSYKDPSALSDINQSVFISYTGKDKRFVKNLAKDIEGYGIKVWIDEGELKIGDSLIWTISQAITKCDFFLVVLSKNSVESNWVKKELEIAFSEELSQSRYKILPIVKDKCEIPPFLKGKLYSDFSKSHKRKENITKLVFSICPSRSLIDYFEQAFGKENLRKNVPLGGFE